MTIVGTSFPTLPQTSNPAHVVRARISQSSIHHQIGNQMGPLGQKFLLNFQEEIAMIDKQSIRDFVLLCADTVVPAYFWERAASSSGKYHPSFVLGVGGLVRHVKYVCWWADRLSRTIDAPDGKNASPLRNHVIAAALLHDCVKDGDPALDHLKRSYTQIGGCHGIDMAQAIMSRVIKDRPPTEDESLIIMAIATHMGPWTKPDAMSPYLVENPKLRQCCILMHIADYAAAQKVEEPTAKLSAFVVK